MQSLLKIGAGAIASVMPLIGVAGPAWGQSTGQDVQKSDAVDGEGGIVDIVVTATRRSSALGTLPSSVSSLTEDALLDRGARSIEDYILAVPGVSFSNAGEEIGREFIVRGISSLGSSATTTIYVDETPLPADIRLFDVERVEVLRGPQGTLFGASTMGGAIRTITRKPRADRFEGRGEASASSTRFANGWNYSLNGGLNLPLIDDRLALRVSLYRDVERGFIKSFLANLDPVQRKLVPSATRLDGDSGNGRVQGARVALGYRPDDDTDVVLTYYRQDEKQAGFNTNDASFYGRDLARARTFAERSKSRFNLINATVTSKFGDINVISSSSYQWGNPGSNETDATAAFAGLMFRLNEIVAPFIVGQVRSIPITNDRHNSAFTQEIRLQSTGDAPFKWLLGGYLTQERIRNLQRILVDPSGATTLPGSLLVESAQRYKADEQALFGEASYRIGGLTLTAGVRKYWIGNSYRTERAGLLPNVFGDDLVVGPYRSSQTGQVMKFNASYRIGDATIYAQSGSGYRPGGANTPNPLAGLPGEREVPSGYKTDKLWQHEIGLRLPLMARRISLHAAAYHTDWSDIQTLQTTDSGFLFYDNFGKATTRGLELEILARPVDILTLGGAYTYTKARYDSDLPAEGVAKGDPIPNIPRRMWNLFGQLELPVSSGWTATFRTEATHVGARKVEAGRTQLLDRYTTLDMRFGLESERYQISLFADNLTDERRVVGARTTPTVRYNFIRPRTIGARLIVRY